jgi:hypothetical protein
VNGGVAPTSATTGSGSQTSATSTGTPSPTPPVSEGVVLGGGGTVLLNGVAGIVAVGAVWAGLI